MAALFSAQLDFIFFFYGLAFILLGSVCFAIARSGEQGTPWFVLGSFGFLHGVSEWLDLLALIVGDTPNFVILRFGVMLVSFMVLFEFARLEGARLGWPVPGRWIYLPLLLLVAGGAYFDGVQGANAMARYAFGLTGAAATSVVLAFDAKGASPAEKGWVISAVLGFALYAVAAGFIVPATTFWPGTIVNHDSFVRLTATPIQLVRGVLACWIAFAIWGVWGQRLMREVASPRYSKFMRRQFIATLAAMGTILVFGWVLTDYLGDIYKRNVQEQALGDLDLIASRLAVDTAAVDGMVKALAGDYSVRLLTAGDRTADSARVKSILQLDSEASAAQAGYILDRAGAVVASYRLDSEADSGAGDQRAAPYVREALAGEAGAHFAVRAGGKERDYYASYPVRGDDGTVTGVAVLKKSLDTFENDIRRFNRSFYLVDSRGIVVVTNRAKMLFTPLWPPPMAERPAPSKDYVGLNSKPALDREIVGSQWVTVGGARDYVQRRPIAQSGWSLVTMTASQGIYASRVWGIIITLQMATLALVYLVGRERWVHDNIQLQKRLDLEEVARHLDLRAATDPLTGLYNRRKLYRELATEMQRAQRYKTPLSVVLFDVDHFKDVNDGHGHQTGDVVLVELSRAVAARIRATDVLARWGGEEFLILTPGSDGEMASQLARNLGDAIRALVIGKVAEVTCSFGVAEFEQADTAETIIARADEALYRAKIGGRDRVELASAAVLAQAS